MEPERGSQGRRAEPGRLPEEWRYRTAERSESALYDAAFSLSFAAKRNDEILRLLFLPKSPVSWYIGSVPKIK